MPNGNYTNYPELINYLGNYESCLIEDLNDVLLSNSENFKASIDTIDFGNVEVFNIVGFNQWTIGKNKVIDGSPPLYCKTIEYFRNLNGDFTVPVRSAELINGQIFEHTYYVPNVMHHNLPGSQETLEILLGVFADSAITNFPQYADPPQSYKDILVDLVDESSMAASYYLSQNYPNPFNPHTIIKYEVPFEADVSLKIFDVLGREIATLVNEEKPAGHYEINFFPGNLPSGTYFYQLKTKDYIQTKKMILMR
jgi:hypothetical protein